MASNRRYRVSLVVDVTNPELLFQAACARYSGGQGGALLAEARRELWADGGPKIESCLVTFFDSSTTLAGLEVENSGAECVWSGVP